MKLGRSLGRTPNPFFPVLSFSRHWLGKLALDNVPPTLAHRGSHRRLLLQWELKSKCLCFHLNHLLCC